MPGAGQPSTSRAGVSFELENAAVEDGRIVVTGRWAGVRGLRFVRPTLLIGERSLLATLDHKPWAPGDEAPWTAAFPWDGDEADLATAQLAVMPDVVVPLDGSAPSAPPAPAPAPRKRAPAKRTAPKRTAPKQEPAAANPLAEWADAARADNLESELRDARRALAAAIAERDELRPVAAEAEAVRRELDSTAAERDELRRALDEARSELARAQAAAAREREQSAAQLAEAVDDHEAAVRTRARMETQHDDALMRLADTELQRDRALAQRDEARAQRNDILVAHEALQRRVTAEVVGHPEPSLAEIEPEFEPASPDRPIGVKAIPAGRFVAPDMHRLERDRRRANISVFDVWALRVLGAAAATGFVLLLVAILRAFAS